MTIRDVLVIIAMVIGWVVAISLLTDDDPAQSDTTGPLSLSEPEPPQARKESKPEPPFRPAQTTTESTENPTPAAKIPSATRRRQGKRPGEPPGERFNERVLIDLDYSQDTIRFIRMQWERSAEGKDEQANRSDRNDLPIEELQDTHIDDKLRSDLGDDLYDAMLYATNQPNRAKVSNVVRTSPAAEAGMRIRDVIVSYDGRRIFEPESAKRLSEQADPGRRIAMWIRRDGKDIQLFVQGGALGIRYFPEWRTPSRAK